MKKLIKSSVIILLFWIGISWLFQTNNLASDGEKTYGIPFKVVIIYWSRKENIGYDYSINYLNLFLDLLFILIVSFFYYLLFVRKKINEIK